MTNRPRYPFIASNNDRCQGVLGVLGKGIYRMRHKVRGRKSEIRSSKLQTNSKRQRPNGRNTRTSPPWNSPFGDWDLFGIWSLEVGAFGHGCRSRCEKQPPRRMLSGRLFSTQTGLVRPVLRSAVSGLSFPLARQSDFLPCELGFEVQASAARLLHIAILIPSAAVASIALHIAPLNLSGSPPIAAFRHAGLLT